MFSEITVHATVHVIDAINVLYNNFSKPEYRDFYSNINQSLTLGA